MSVQLYVVYVYCTVLYSACGAHRAEREREVGETKEVCLGRCLWLVYSSKNAENAERKNVWIPRLHHCSFLYCVYYWNNIANSYRKRFAQFHSPISVVFLVCSSSCFEKYKIQCKHLFFHFVKRDITGGSIDSKIPTIVSNTLVRARARTHTHKSLYFTVSVRLAREGCLKRSFLKYKKPQNVFSLFKQCVLWFSMLNV